MLATHLPLALKPHPRMHSQGVAQNTFQVTQVARKLMLTLSLAIIISIPQSFSRQSGKVRGSGLGVAWNSRRGSAFWVTESQGKIRDSGICFNGMPIHLGEKVHKYVLTRQDPTQLCLSQH